MKYSVPVVVMISGYMEVEADSPEESIEVAKLQYDESSLKGRSTDIDFANGEDPNEVEVEQ